MSTRDIFESALLLTDCCKSAALLVLAMIELRNFARSCRVRRGYRSEKPKSVTLIETA